MKHLAPGVAFLFFAAGPASAGIGNDMVVDFHDLKALLPATLPGGLTPEDGSPSGQTAGRPGHLFSMATGKYGGFETGEIIIIIRDMPNTGMAKAVAINKHTYEDGNGYTKTTTFNGYPARMVWNRKFEHGSIQLGLNDRFVVEAQGHHVTMDRLEDALTKIDLKKLATLTPKAGTGEPPVATSSPNPKSGEESTDESPVTPTRRASDIATLRNIAMACLLYAGEHEDQLPPTLDDIAPRMGKGTDLTRFELVAKGKLSDIKDPAVAVLVRTKQPSAKGARAAAFADGHAGMTD